MTEKNEISTQRAHLSPAKQALLEKRLRGKAGSPTRKTLTIPRRASTGPAPLSFVQERLWFLHQLVPDSAAYNWYRAVSFKGPLDILALRQSLHALVCRHEILQTTFTVQEGRPVQLIAPPLDLELPLVDLQDLPLAERQAEAHRRAVAEAARPFDLSQGPLLRTTLLRLEADAHTLLLTMPHILADNWSDGVLWRELAAFYQSFAAGTPSSVPELPIQYADFAAWQREWLQGEVLEGQLAYWRGQLGGDLPHLQLPTDFPRPARQSFRGARQSLSLSPTLAEGLKALSLQQGTTLFMTLLAAFKVLLYRYTHQADLIVGTPIANRNYAELEGLVGLFLNTLALRTDLSGNPSFIELLGRVRKSCLGAYNHQDLPFEKLVEILHPARDLSYNPLFQVMFVLLNSAKVVPGFPGLTVEMLEVDNKTAQFDLILFMEETEAGLVATLNYNTDLFEAATIERMLGHWQTLLAGIVSHPETPLGQLPLLTEAERHRLLAEWVASSVHHPPDKVIHQAFETQVAARPEAVALVFEDQQMTYGELNARANRLAHYLRQQGVGPGIWVALYLERSLELLVGILGVLKAGGAYVPLDPVYPPERLAFILEDTGAPLVLTQQGLRPNLPEAGVRCFCLDTEWETLAATAGVTSENPALTVQANDPAYLIYTSGSTGQPKGVIVSHYNVMRLFQATLPWYNFDQNDIWTLFHSYAFDFSVWEIWGALLYGGRLVVVPYWVSRSPEAFYELLVKEGVTVLNQTPSAFQQLIRAEEARGVSEALALRLVIFGGEALELHSLKPWFERHGDQVPQLVNMYGITETTVHVTYRPLTLADAQEGVGSMIGIPIPDLQLYILDEHLQPVPIGVPGELYVGGAGLAHGYLHRPHLSAERFITHPFSSAAGDRLYKTGDLVRYCPNRDIEYLGRMDHQVKIRGFRIELGEIEALLAQHPEVRETVALAREDNPGHKRLVAYLVPNRAEAPAAEALRQFLKEKLPDYMVPAAFVTLERLPLTPNGKIDRQALPVPDQVVPAPEKDGRTPRDLLELQLLKLWEETLDLQSVGVDDNFFDLGGQSLLAVRLIIQIERVTGRKLPLASLFQAPTVAQLAALLRQAGWSAPTSSVVAIQPNGSKPPLFFVPGNLGNVFTDLRHLVRHLDPDQPFYGLQDSMDNPIGVADLARQYVSEIRKLQPEGPYLLGGICSGGLIAFEMAQQLQREGHPVALLALVEVYPQAPGLQAYAHFTTGLLRRFLRRAGHQARQISQVSAAEQGDYFRLKAKVIGNMWGVVRYTPQAYPGRIELFLTREALDSVHTPHLHWRELTGGGIGLHEIPGSHASITGDNGTEIEEASMSVLAEQLRLCIGQLLIKSSGPETEF